MRAEEIIIKAMRRAKEERGLNAIESSGYLSEGHIKKADHNLIVMTDLARLGHDDWVIISAYYAMYQSAMSLLSRIGLDSKDHATTAAVLEYFFRELISLELIEKFNELKVRKDKIEAITIEEKYIDYLWKTKRIRESAQYGISLKYREVGIVMGNAREFVSRIKLALKELDEEMAEIIIQKARELKGRVR